MVFAFPSGLNQELFPLAWLVGEWEGEGQISYHEQVPTARAWNHIKFSHDGGSYLKYESTIRIIGEGEAPIPGPVLPVEPIGASYATGHSAQPFEFEAPSDDGANPSVERPRDTSRVVETTDDATPSVEESEARLETTAEGVAPHDGEVWSSETGYWRINPLPHGSGKDNEFYLDIFIVDAGGRMTFFNGEATPGRIELASAKMVRAALAAEVNGSKRMYGYINDHLAWAEDLVAFGHDLGSYASFFLHRTVDGDGNPVTGG